MWRENVEGKAIAGKRRGKNYYSIPPRMEAEILGGNCVGEIVGRKLWGEKRVSLTK